MNKLAYKRIYEPYDENDGYRILIDRLWPRGIKKEDAKIDYWDKDITPTTNLRKWFNHDPEKFNEFKEKYLIELENNDKKDEYISIIKENLKNKNVTLLYGAKDEKYNHAIILYEWTKNKL